VPLLRHFSTATVMQAVPQVTVLALELEGFASCPGPPGRLSALSVSLCKSVFYGAFVWARRALKSQKWRFPARAVSMRHSATATVAFLNEIFGHCDRLVARHGLEKIATGFGSRYCPGPPGRLSALSVFLCKSFFYGVFVWARRALNTQKRWFPARAVAVAGLPLVRDDHAYAGAECALNIVRELTELLRHKPRTITGLRIGLHTGPVIAGVLGTGPVSYDVWGETVSTAVRLQLAAPSNAILLTKVVADQIRGAYTLVARGTVKLKRRDPAEMFQLKNRVYGEGYVATLQSKLPSAPANL
jgi:class 3 adenylate cyclase